jgi:L-2-hydroxyglutarate oxidase
LRKPTIQIVGCDDPTARYLSPWWQELSWKNCPRIELGDLEPYPVGIRAQAVQRDGTMVDDFLFEQTPRSLHVCNAPSPAATSAIPIARHICDMLTGTHKSPA